MKPQKTDHEVSAKSLQNGILFLDILFAVLPFFISLTAYSWLGAVYGDDGTAYYYGNVSRYWSFFVYLLGAALTILALIGGIPRWRTNSLQDFRNRTWIRSHFLGFYLALLLFWSFLSFLFAKEKQPALWGDCFCHEGLVLYIFYGAFFLTGSWLSKKRMGIVTEILVLVCSAMGLLQIVYRELPRTLFYIEEPRALMFHQYNHFGYFLSVCAPLAMGLFLQEEKQKFLRYSLRILELWLIFNAMVYNSTRGSFLSVLLILVFWNFYIFFLHREKRVRILTLDGLFLATLFFLNTGGALGQRMLLFLADFQNLASSADKQTAIDSLGTRRGILWRNGIRFSFQKPLFGFGPANLEEPYRAVKSHSSSPHCDLILIAASLGLPALTFYVVGLAGHVTEFFHRIRQLSIFEVTLFAGAAGYFFSALMGVSMYYTAPCYFLILGFSYGILQERETASEKGLTQEQQKPRL